MVPTRVFLQELHEPSISKALAKGYQGGRVIPRDSITKRENN
jgi:hypothetical protein